MSLATACGGGDKATSGGEVDLMSMVPENASGVMAVNFKKIVDLEVFDQMIEKAKAEKPSEGAPFKSYDDFIAKTGIDPKKDVYGMAVGIMGEMKGAGEPDVVAVMNINYDKAKIMAIINERKEEIKEFSTEAYEGIDLFGFKDEKGKDMGFSFVNDALVAIGKKDALKQVIDLSKGKGKSVMDNADKKALFKQLNGDAVMSFMFELPEEAKKVQGEGSPFKVDLSKAESLLGFVDYAPGAWKGELKLLAKDEATNQQIAQVLNSLKGFGAMAGPEVGELVNNINITSAADHIKVDFTVSDELVKKLQEMAKKKAASAMAQPTEETVE
jgi:hypothetical protein